MMETELDMEDIESRLYSQVHHSSAEDEQHPNVIIPTRSPLQSIHSNPYTVSNVPRHVTHRYFHKEHVNQPLQPTYISFDDINSLQNNVSISPTSTDITTEGNFSNQFQNNITVNQYTLPVIINSEFNEVLSPKYFTSWAVQNQHLVGKKRKRSKKERNRDKRKQDQNKKESKFNSVLIGVNLNEDVQKQVNEVICVSDDSDECIIEGVVLTSPFDGSKISTGFPKKYNDDDETSKKPESDDDIIFIPPPPLEVIMVDGDEIEESTQITLNSPENANKLSTCNPKPIQKELGTPESSASNDFLDSAGIENSTNNFNFGLHGSDFNNSQGEFVRPANPVDFCETESSCSTNELNRDFNNSVKTIVFHEVEFPREDIFSENNLERFGSYITPRRNRNKELDNVIVCSENIETRNVEEVNSSSDSSSESDYADSKYVGGHLKSGGLEISRKLPTLSPMLSEGIITELTTPKRVSSKKKTASEFFKGQSPTVSVLPKKDFSRKKIVVDISETDSDTGKETNSGSKKLERKKKKKKKMSVDIPLESCSELVVDSDSRKKRKTKHVLQNYEEDGNNLEKCEKKNRKGTSETNNSESGENTDECRSQKKRRKKPLHSEIHKSDVLAQQLSVEVARLPDSEQIQDKKKKGSLDSNNAQNENIGDLGVSSSQKRKTKNSQVPKTIQNNNIEPNALSDQAEEIVRHEFPEKSRSRKKKGCSESNSGNEENIDATRNKKRSRSGSGSPEKNSVPLDAEEIGNRKKNRYLELVSEPECRAPDIITEKSKKKKRKSEKECPDTDDSAGEKQQKMKKISFSELLDHQAQDVEIRIEAEVQKKKKKKSSPQETTVSGNTLIENYSSTANSDNFIIELGLSQEKDKEPAETKQQHLDESILGHTIKELSVSSTNEVESSAMEVAEENDSDEELIVVDDIDPYSPNLIVVDQVESTVIDAEVVLSSDSEYDFKELSDVGKDLELANCIVQGGTNDDSEELIVVDEDSSGNLGDRYAVDEDYSNFNVDAIQSTQTDDPEAWKVSYKDRSMVINRNRGPRCNRCRQFGHIAVRCTEKLFPPNCNLCGTPGHEEPRCPNKICRQCGNEGDYSTSYCWKCFKFRNSICKLCNMEGHIAKTCPDLWRRYHLTTKEGPLVVLQQPQLKPKDLLWCSGCAQQGHLEHECHYFREYQPFTPSVVSYEDVLNPETANSLFPKFDNSSAHCSRSKKVSMPPLHDILTPCSQSLPTHSSNIASDRCKPKEVSSPQSKVSILPLPDTETPRGISLNEISSRRESASSENSGDSTARTTTESCVVPLSESENVPNLRPDTGHTIANTNPTSAEPSKPSTSIVPVYKLDQCVDNKYKFPSPPNRCLSFTEGDYDNLLLEANHGLLGHIRSIQFGRSFASDNTQDHQVQLLRANKIEQLTRHLIREDQHRIRCTIMYKPLSIVREFLRKEMSELKCWVSARDPRFLIEQYFKYNKLSRLREPLTTKTVSDKCFWFRILNMFLFGVHEFDKGKQCMRLLEKFLMMRNPNINRGNLVQAHKQIFGVDKHGGVNYPALIQQIIDR